MKLVYTIGKYTLTKTPYNIQLKQLKNIARKGTTDAFFTLLFLLNPLISFHGLINIYTAAKEQDAFKSSNMDNGEKKR